MNLKKALEISLNGMFVANPSSSQTSVEGVFAGGDAATGSKSVIQAVVSAVAPPIIFIPI